MAKYKLFSGDDPTKLEADVNKWASSHNPPVEIVHSDTKIQKITLKANNGTATKPAVIATVGVWYR